MTPEAQRIAIAEVLWKHACGQTVNWPPLRRFEKDYLNDLNACHEMEKMQQQSAQQWQEYERNLRAVTLREGIDGSGLNERLIRATAAQRAEAFLKAKGLWTTP